VAKIAMIAERNRARARRASSCSACPNNPSLVAPQRSSSLEHACSCSVICLMAAGIIPCSRAPCSSKSRAEGTPEHGACADVEDSSSLDGGFAEGREQCRGKSSAKLSSSDDESSTSAKAACKTLRGSLAPRWRSTLTIACTRLPHRREPLTALHCSRPA
jgi:hypothetical protein